MPNKINLDKIYKELSKGNADEQYDAYQNIKNFIQKSIEQQQKDLEEKSNQLQSKIDRINGN
jgi:Skp family chaperone for outer membrane proteins